MNDHATRRPVILASALYVGQARHMSPPSKKIRGCEKYLRPDLTEESIISLIKSSWFDSSKDDCELKSSIKVIKHPFRVCVIDNVISSTELLKSTVNELKNVQFKDKSNDLYQFRQSDDLSNLREFKSTQYLYDCIRNEARAWICRILGDIDLKESVSATFSSYSYKDRLLCHDDKCGDRHIAFILYLVEEWNKEDGGALELFSANSGGYPDEIVKSIYPQFNMMVFFEVTNTSFHQVSEVLTKNKDRISLNGWFHLPRKSLKETECHVLEFEKNYGTEDSYNLKDYFSQIYFEQENNSNIKALFTASSEIQLDSFLVQEFLNELKNDLKSDKLNWISRGPPNVRKYEAADSSNLPSSVRTIRKIFESKCWLKFLKSLTGLDFVPSETSDMKIWESGILPKCSCEIQRWTHSSYTLIHDKNSEFSNESLDVVLRIPFREADEDGRNENDEVPKSGHLIYIDSESKEEECLLHIGYKMNSLALIFRDSKTLRFTKYLDVEAEPYYQIFCSYYPWQPPLDQPNLKHCEDEESTSDYSISDSSVEIAAEEESEG